MTKQNPTPPSFTLHQQLPRCPSSPMAMLPPGSPGLVLHGEKPQAQPPGPGTGWQRLLWAGAQPRRRRKRAKVLWCSQRHLAVPPLRQHIPPWGRTCQGRDCQSCPFVWDNKALSCAASHKKEGRKSRVKTELYFCSSRAGRAPLRCQSPGGCCGLWRQQEEEEEDEGSCVCPAHGSAGLALAQRTP